MTYKLLLIDCQARGSSHSGEASLQALAFFSLRVNYTAETIAMVFFGLNTLVTGYLLFRSTSCLAPWVWCRWWEA